MQREDTFDFWSVIGSMTRAQSTRVRVSVQLASNNGLRVLDALWQMKRSLINFVSGARNLTLRIACRIYSDRRFMQYRYPIDWN